MLNRLIIYLYGILFAEFQKKWLQNSLNSNLAHLDIKLTSECLVTRWETLISFHVFRKSELLFLPSYSILIRQTGRTYVKDLENIDKKLLTNIQKNLA